MSTVQSDTSTPRMPLRLWLAVVAAVLQWLLWFVVPIVAPERLLFGMIGGLVCGVFVLVWWLFFSRVPWSDRLGALVLIVVGIIATKRVVHPSIAGAGMGNLMYILALPVMSLALVTWAVACRPLATTPRRVSMVAAILLGCGIFTLVRTGGITGGGVSDFHWRWTPSPEERLLARANEEPAPLPTAPKAADASETRPTARAADAPIDAARGGSAALPSAPAVTQTPEKSIVPKADHEAAALPSAAAGVKTRADWPGFRGPERDGVVRGVQIKTDWAASPPVELWRRPIGPGWSSFAVHGDFLYTQEQRGDDEIVASYKVSTGEPVWRHRDPVRFFESNGGAGPRATPTLSGDRVYTFGATGIVNALDAGSGAVVWSRNAAADTGVEIPGWGFTSSPLVYNDLVIVAASGRLVAYDAATGNRRWLGPAGGGGYSSPHLVKIDGVDQVVLLRGSRTISLAPADGTLLWEHVWIPSVSIVQPAVIANGDILISSGDAMGGIGVRRLAVTHASAGWTVEERWTSRGLKPYFNDFVVHKGHAFGFDGSILACIDLEDGARKWKGGRFGNGQLVLLPDQDLLLVTSEDGELALVGAKPDKFTELARFPALNAKTWNHPALVGDVLLIRNGEEMVAYRLSLATVPSTN